MIMMDQSKRLREPLRWPRTGRLALIATCVLLVVAIATVAMIASTSGSSHRAGCVEVTFASTLGAAIIRPCGTKARTLCANPAENPAAAAHNALREACGRAGLPYGRSSGTG